MRARGWIPNKEEDGRKLPVTQRRANTLTGSQCTSILGCVTTLSAQCLHTPAHTHNPLPGREDRDCSAGCHHEGSRSVFSTLTRRSNAILITNCKDEPGEGLQRFFERDTLPLKRAGAGASAVCPMHLQYLSCYRTQGRPCTSPEAR